jgi:hypothetical protein
VPADEVLRAPATRYAQALVAAMPRRLAVPQPVPA